ncbi:MAG: outer membrane beta-barrel protein [Bacteroidia bacterium]|nr:outer membrane beta-barrel protein [Bacteroidia bacterium]
MNKQLLSFSLLLVLVGSAFAQTERSKQLPSVAIGAGILSFNGDVGTGVNLSSFSRIRTGYNLTIEQRIGKYLGVSVNGLYGKLADSERSKERNLNFQSQIIQADLNLVIHFDNDLVFKRNSAFAPYLFGGFGYLIFDPYGDLKDKNNVAYNYWSDGTIRDIAETDTNANASILLQRDYTYETQLKDSTTNYARSSFAIPVGVGFQLKISDNVAANIGASYYLAMTDWIDNFKNGANDRYIFANVSLQYNFGKPYDDSDPIYRSVDFSALDKLDTDEDGVKDGDDRCPGTPKGVKVDNRGCPEDLDEDGVPDYRDKEALTKKGALVDENGITQTDQMIMQRQAERDSLATERSNMFNENPSLSFLRDIESKNLEERKNNPNAAKASSIPVALRPADKNNDGYISTEEITMAIDSFFEGDSIFTVERLNDLIDFFFEQ